MHATRKHTLLQNLIWCTDEDPLIMTASMVYDKIVQGQRAFHAQVPQVPVFVIDNRNTIAIPTPHLRQLP